MLIEKHSLSSYPFCLWWLPLDIFKYDVYRGPNIGLYVIVNDSHVFVPRGFAKTKSENLAKYLKTDFITTSIAGTRLLGALSIVNNQGMLLPQTAAQYELEHLKKETGLNVEMLNSKFTALGNLICANDKGAIVSPAIPKEAVKQIRDVLDVEVLQKRVAGFHQAGVMVRANSHGGVIHPETDERDIKTFENILGVGLEPATINGGIPYVASGILVNNNAVVVGNMTSGPEIMMLTRAFFN